jgi:hypothetical protein
METNRENLTFSAANLVACRPIVGEGGHVLRALCPFHGSDRQRSLRVQLHSGRFVCFACGAWGYMETARAQWREEQQRHAAFQRPAARPQRLQRQRHAAAAKPPAPRPPAPREPAPARPNLVQPLAAFQAALPGAAAPRPSASAACRWRWPSNSAWALRRRAAGRTPHAIGAAAAWFFRTPRRMASW